MGQTPETKFKNQIIKFLNSINAYHIPYFPTIHTPSGIPDRYCCVNGNSFWVEVKSEKGRLSEIQEYQITKMKDHKIIVKVLYPKDFEEFKLFCISLKEEHV